MRLFQNSSLYPSYVPRLRELASGTPTFKAQMAAQLADRYGAPHLLLPVLERDPSAFAANGHDRYAQELWATEQGMPRRSSLEDILLAQVEHHRTEVLYNLDPINFPGTFARRLPGSVKSRIAWRAAPSGRTDFSGYDLMVCNFPGILESFRRSGLKAAYFAPAFDPLMEPYAANLERPIDIAFVGSYSRHHTRRTAVLEAICGLASKFSVALHLETSRVTRLAELPLVRAMLPGRYARPPAVRRLASAPLFGLDLYKLLSRSKIVINTAIDMAGEDRGNIRCFEALGTGSLLLTDKGRYPEGMVDGETMVTFGGADELGQRVEELLGDLDRLQSIASRGSAMLMSRYSKQVQWESFLRLAAMP